MSVIGEIGPFKGVNKRNRAVESQVFYAHIEIVVAFLVVNFFGFLVIARDHGSFEGRH